jgi:type III restriction enzyme
MGQVVIENPVINSPYTEPKQHFRFDDEGITNEIVEGRRTSQYFIPIARPKKQSAQRSLFGSEWTAERIEENRLVNRIRQRVDLWRRGGYLGITPITRSLLEYWTNPEREHRLFFCQIEALETAIYITEAARKYGDGWIENELRSANDGSNPGLPRIALKMATGSGKTVVMAMLIAWQALNKLANTQDPRFSDTFLIITPGITIRDRLRVLLPNDPDNYYRRLDVLPPDSLERLGQAKILITNFHAFQLRETVSAGKLTKAILAQGEGSADTSSSPFIETPAEMVRRVCRELGNKKNIIIINDEAHHCYRRRPDSQQLRLDADERAEARRNEEYARVWISGIEAVKQKIGVKVIYDLSATPFFLRGSGWPEGTLFPWVVSDFSLIDAIEAGIVKVPRVPVADDSMMGEQPTYRDLWLRIRDDLPKKGRKTEAVGGEPRLPKELQGALHSLYSNYEKHYRQWTQSWEQDLETRFLRRNRISGGTPPVFIVVCNNTNVSKLVFDYIAGWEKQFGKRTFVQAGGLELFRNDDGRGGWLQRPNTILVDSEQLESGEAMSSEFKDIAAREIEEFKAEYRQRFPGRDAEQLTDEDLLREVMNTVGKPGKLGEHVRCVVSVSMLTEGWDANTVTHVLGVRAFGTQLLCEQVVGRALRRMSYTPDENGMFPAEYAEVYGVPFSFIPSAGSNPNPTPGKIPTRVRALAERIPCEITFPRLKGYRFDLPAERLAARFTGESKLALTTADIPTRTENAPIVGESSIHTLDDLKRHRKNEVAFMLAKLALNKYFSNGAGDGNNAQVWLFPQLLDITRQWLDECLYLKDNTFMQMLFLVELAHNAADRIYQAIVRSADGEATLKPNLRDYDTVGSTNYVDFDTTRPVYATDESKCHINYVVADTDSWEQKMAQTLEEMPEVVHYVKNQGLNFTIPYTFEGKDGNYTPDFIVHLDDGRGPDDFLNLIIEVSGEARPDKAAKVNTARTLWIPAVNNHGDFGRWAFLEISDPWDAQNTMRSIIRR